MKKYCYLIGLFLIFFIACDDYNALTEDIMKEGEITYLQKIDSFKISTGNERLRFRFWYFNGNRLDKTIIYWNNRTDSLEVQLNLKNGIDSLDYEMKLPEDNYNFQIYNKDILNNSSLPVNIFAIVYGNEYKNRLMQRMIQSAKIDQDNKLYIDWYGTDAGFVFTEIKYKSINGNTVTVKGSSEKSQILENFPSSETFSYRTAYIPEPDAIDTFYTQWSKFERITKK